MILGKEREFLTWFYTNYTVVQSSIDDTTIAEYIRTFASVDGIRGAFGVYRSVFTSVHQTETLTKETLKTPVLGLGGDKSIGDKVQAMLSKVFEICKGGAVKDCGHFIPDEQPEYLIESIFKFLDAIKS